MPEPSEFDLMALLPPAGQAACETKPRFRLYESEGVH